MGTKQTKITRKSIKKECRDLVLLCRRGDLKSTTRLVLLTLWSYTDSHGWCWPSQVSLARDTSLTERSISKAMKELRARHSASSRAKSSRRCWLDAQRFVRGSAAKKQCSTARSRHTVPRVECWNAKVQVGGCSIARTSTYPRGLACKPVLGNRPKRQQPNHLQQLERTERSHQGWESAAGLQVQADDARCE